MIDSQSRKALIKSHPFFETFRDIDISELAELALEKECPLGEVLVKEGDLVDSIYLLYSGEIEIDIGSVPLRVMRSGEAIGLSATGFYSQTGVRTATLKAITTLELLYWDLEIFHRFLERHPEYKETMAQAAQKMLRANFIKKAAPFSDLSSVAVMDLAAQVEEMKLPAQTMLFRQGDHADECYLVVEGEVQILLNDTNGQARLIATEGPGQLFGEGAVLHAQRRAASALISKDTKLLVLKAKLLHALMEQPHTAEAMMGLVAEHWRPIQVVEIEHYHRTNEEGLKITILKDKRRKRYYQLSEEGWLIWQLLNGQRNLEEITVELYKARKFFSPEAVSDLILNMAEAGFVFLPELGRNKSDEAAVLPSTRWQHIKRRFQEWRYLTWLQDDIDPMLSKIYRAGIHRIFTLPAQFFLAMLAVVGAVLFAMFLKDFNLRIPAPFFVVIACIAVFFAHLLSTIFHELAHGFTVKYYGRDVHRAGVLFGWLGLAAFVDTSDMWLSPNGPRVVVSLAGPYTDFIMAGAFSILAFFIPQQTVSLFFWLLALILYFSVIKNLNPLRDNDGYVALKDALNAPNLQKDAFFWVKHPAMNLNKEAYTSIIYWLICGAFLSVSIFLAFVARHYLGTVFPLYIFDIQTDQILWALPLLVIAQFVFTLLKLLRRP